MLLVASCYRSRDKLRPDGPLGSYADATLSFLTLPWCHAELCSAHLTMRMSQVCYLLKYFALLPSGAWGVCLGDRRYQVTLSTCPSVLQAPGDGIVLGGPASRVAMDTSTLLLAFGPPLTFQAPAPKLIFSDEFKCG